LGLLAPGDKIPTYDNVEKKKSVFFDIRLWTTLNTEAAGSSETLQSCYRASL